MTKSEIDNMPTGADKLGAKLWNAFRRGSKREFFEAVSALGAVSAANLLVRKLMEEENGATLLRQRDHLFLPNVLRCVKGSENLFPTLLRGVIYWSTNPSDSQLKLLEALSWRIQPGDLDLVHPSSVSPKIARVLAITLHCDKRLREEWMKVAVHACDRAIFDAFKETLSREEWIRLWEWSIWTEGLVEMNFLLDNAPLFESEGDKLYALEQVVVNRSAQPRILELLLQAWPNAAAAMRLSSAKQTELEYWEGHSFRQLLLVGAEITRQDWVDIFCWENSHVFADQIEAFTGSEAFAGWETPNADGRTFLLEADARLSKAALPVRLRIIATLLSTGADPEPLLRISRSAIAPEEMAMLELASEERKRRKAALRSTAEVVPMETDIELA